MSHQSDLIATDIKHYLHQHENKELLRLLTCGSVDDGKSTLIGRLLHDSKMIYEDQLAAITHDSKKVGTTGEAIDLALLVDGLQAEREQGITIDVAYRYFSTSKRKFIIADTPGHEQYTRNMATGASTCDLAIILIDARHGVQVQTRRHSFIVSLLGIRHTIVAINKMDLVDYSEQRFNEIKADYLAFAKDLNLPDIHFAPISALNGDNVVNPSEHMPWFTGEPLMEQLESIEIAQDQNFDELRFPVQYVNRPNLNFRGYCGTITSGIVRVGDEVAVLPSGKTSRVKSIVTWDGELTEAFAPMAVTLTLEDEIDISRGDLLVLADKAPKARQAFSAHLVWMDETPLNTLKDYEVKLATRRQTGKVTRIHHKIDVNTLVHSPAAGLELNEIAKVEVQLEQSTVADDYRQHKGTGSFILVDRLTHRTVAAGMILPSDNENPEFNLTHTRALTPELWSQRLGQSAQLIQLSSTHKDTARSVLFTLEKALFERGHFVYLLDADTHSASPEAIKLLASSLLETGFIVLTNVDIPLDQATTLTLDSESQLDTQVTNILRLIV